MNFRGARTLNAQVSAAALTGAVESQLRRVGTTGIEVEGLNVRVKEIRVDTLREQAFVLRGVLFSPVGSPIATELAYSADATPWYSPRFSLLLAVPVCMAVGYALTISPLVLVAVPVGFGLLLATRKASLAVWFEELALSIEKSALEAVTQ
jgi:hypothetical protein